MQPQAAPQPDTHLRPCPHCGSSNAVNASRCWNCELALPRDPPPTDPSPPGGFDAEAAAADAWPPGIALDAVEAPAQPAASGRRRVRRRARRRPQRRRHTPRLPSRPGPRRAPGPPRPPRLPHLPRPPRLPRPIRASSLPPQHRRRPPRRSRPPHRRHRASRASRPRPPNPRPGRRQWLRSRRRPGRPRLRRTPALGPSRHRPTRACRSRRGQPTPTISSPIDGPRTTPNATRGSAIRR